MQPVWRTFRKNKPDGNSYHVVKQLEMNSGGGLMGLILKHRDHCIFYAVPLSGDYKLERVGPVYSLKDAETYLLSSLGR